MHDAVTMRVVSASAIWTAVRATRLALAKARPPTAGEGRAIDILHHQENGRTVRTDVKERADIGGVMRAMTRARGGTVRPWGLAGSRARWEVA